MELKDDTYVAIGRDGRMGLVATEPAFHALSDRF